jgi:phosphoglycerate kinase
MLEESAALWRLTDSIRRPYAVVLGGAKVADKLPVVASLLRTADRILIGGAMAWTFLAAQGHPTGTSLLEGDQDAARSYLNQAVDSRVELVLPRDVLVAHSRAAGEPGTVVPARAIPADQMGLDIGPVSARLFAARLATARTIFWNGPMGVYELPAFAQGTRAVAQAMIGSHAFTMVGGGDTVAAVRALGFDDCAFGHVSTGGGASLEFLDGKVLPGLAALATDYRIAAA